MCINWGGDFWNIHYLLQIIREFPIDRATNFSRTYSSRREKVRLSYCCKHEQYGPRLPLQTSQPYHEHEMPTALTNPSSSCKQNCQWAMILLNDSKVTMNRIDCGGVSMPENLIARTRKATDTRRMKQWRLVHNLRWSLRMCCSELPIENGTVFAFFSTVFSVRQIWL